VAVSEHGADGCGGGLIQPESSQHQVISNEKMMFVRLLDERTSLRVWVRQAR
jgi:hypothetical protein